MPTGLKRSVRASEAKEWAKSGGLPVLWHIMTVPFADDFGIDEAAIRHNIEWAKQLGCRGIAGGGNIAEVYTLANDERMRVLEIALDADKGESVFYAFPICDSLPETIRLAEHAQSVGADMLLVSVPYEHVKTHDTIYQYVKALADKTDIAICLFTTWHSGYVIPPEMVRKLAQDIPAICAIKSVPNTFEETVEVWRQCGNVIQVSACTESRWLESTTEYEGMGQFMMSTACTLMQVPGYTPIKDYTELALKGEIARAREIRDGLQQTRGAWQQIYNCLVPGHSYRHPVARIKCWQDCLGMRGGQVRPPSERLTTEDEVFIKREVQLSPLSKHIGGAKIEERG